MPLERLKRKAFPLVAETQACGLYFVGRPEFSVNLLTIGWFIWVLLIQKPKEDKITPEGRRLKNEESSPLITGQLHCALGLGSAWFVVDVFEYDEEGEESIQGSQRSEIVGEVVATKSF